MAVLWLQSDHLCVVFEALLVLVSEEVALGAFVDVGGLVVGQFDGLGERSDGFFVHVKVGIGDAQVIVDVSLVGLERVVLQGTVQILYSLLEFLIAVVGQPTLVKYLGLSGLSTQGI